MLKIRLFARGLGFFLKFFSITCFLLFEISVKFGVFNTQIFHTLDLSFKRLKITPLYCLYLKGPTVSLNNDVNITAIA